MEVEQSTLSGEHTVIRRGELYYADLSPVTGSEQGGFRPVLILQNDIGNRYSPTTVVAAVTSRLDKPRLPTHVAASRDCGLAKESIILLEQLRTVDKRRLAARIGQLSDETMLLVERALAVSLALPSPIASDAPAAEQRRTPTA